MGGQLCVYIINANAWTERVLHGKNLLAIEAKIVNRNVYKVIAYIIESYFQFPGNRTQIVYTIQFEVYLQSDTCALLI